MSDSSDQSTKVSASVEKFNNRWNKGKFVCIGLDSEYAKIPESVRSSKNHQEAIFEFNKQIIDATHDLALSYKPNSAFYEGEGEEGMTALKKTVEYIQEKDSSIPIILDAKRADIGNTNRGYVKNAFEDLNVDSITVNPFLGSSLLQDGERKLETLASFLEQKDKLTIVLCRTSNPAAGEFQDLPIAISDLPSDYREKFGDLAELSEMLGKSTAPLYMVVAFIIAKRWNVNGNLGIVVGATYPEELFEIRKVVGEAPILIPGLGAQGGDLEATVKAGLNSQKQGIILSASRGIIFASKGEDFAEAARAETEKLNDQVQEILNKV